MNKLAKIRKTKLIEQNGRCYYCSQPIWANDRVGFSRHFEISEDQARYLQATAEHLIARSEGGSDCKSNIVAACLYCNQRRHYYHELALPADAYRQEVSMRMSQGGWHPVTLREPDLQQN